MTIKELRDYFNAQEAQWNDEMTHYLGPFEQQQVLTTGWRFDPNGGTSEFRGYSYNNYIICDVTGMGYIIDTKE